MLSSVPAEIIQDLKDHLRAEILNFSFSSGGCINHGGKVETNRGNIFLKWNDLQKFPGMFAAEAKGLSLLAAPKVVAVPEVIFCGSSGAYQYLVLQFIEQGRPSRIFGETLANALAGLHRVTDTHFGLDHDNYIGSLYQPNHQSTSWVDFFIGQRLEIQLKIAVDGQRLDIASLKRFHAFFSRLPVLLPAEAPALLHGDLWTGNVLPASEGAPYLIDPAVYFGHREADLAMTQLFGGFPNSFLESYNDIFPITPGFTERAGIYQLYPLLVHLNLFGGGYQSQVVSIVNRFV
jgi:protein-ribulosamine 3-kinase